MSDDKPAPEAAAKPAFRTAVSHVPGEKQLTPAARRALAEAAERRAAAEKAAKERPSMPKEINGRDGPEPVRYGDWESKGIISDF